MMMMMMAMVVFRKKARVQSPSDVWMHRLPLCQPGTDRLLVLASDRAAVLWGPAHLLSEQLEHEMSCSSFTRSTLLKPHICGHRICARATTTVGPIISEDVSRLAF